MEPDSTPQPHGSHMALDRIYKEAPVGLCVFDTDLRYIYINAWLAALNGISVEEHLGRTVGEVLPDLASRIEPQLRTVIDTGQPVVEGTANGLTIACSGEEQHVQYIYQPIMSGDGSVTGVNCVVMDITDRKQLEVQVRQTQKMEAVASSTAEPLHGTEHLLFVDDEHILVLVYEQIVKTYGYTVTTCTSGLEALALFREAPHRFDIVVTDQTMPQLTGVELAQEILSIRPDVPIILCSGFSATVSSDVAASTGIRDYVMKPIIVPDLLRRIRKIFDDKSGS